MWNRSISLRQRAEPVVDEEGYPIEQNVWMGGIRANFLDVTRNDEILANQIGYGADQIVEIMACNYSGETILLDEATGKEYTIRRTFRKNKKGILQMTCERREQGG